MIKKKRFIKKSLYALLSLLVIFLIVGLIWWYLPYKQIDLTQLTDPSTLVQIDIPSPSGSLTREVIIHQIEKRYLSQINDAFNYRIAKRSLSVLYPQEIRVLMKINPLTKEPIYAIGVNLGRPIKILYKGKTKIETQLFEGRPVSKSILNGYSFVQRTVSAKSDKAMNAMVWMDSGFLASSDIEYLKKLTRQYNSNRISNSTFRSSINISINNTSSFMTDKIKTYEEKYQLDIFPSINQVESIEIQLIPKDDNTITGTMLLQTESLLSEDDPLVSDLNFCFGSIRRALHPMDIELAGELSFSNKNAKLTFELTGLESAISQLENFTKK